MILVDYIYSMPTAKKKRELDLSAFPAGTVTEYSTLVCLACTFDIFTTQLGLAPRTAYSEIKKYSPTVVELTAPQASRPFFDSEEKNPHCPYCNAARRWHARFDTFRIDGGKASDAARRKLIKALPQKDNQFHVIEAKTDKRSVFFNWLDTLDQKLELDDRWLLETTRAYLAGWNPKPIGLKNSMACGPFDVLIDYRRVGKKMAARLFLSPTLYNETLVIQYLVSRSHVHGGHTLEGRLTLQELIRRLRYGGYLEAKGISQGDQFEIFEKLIETLAGGAGNITVYHIVDRTDFLEKVKSVYARYAS